MRAEYVRLSRRRLVALPYATEPPACNLLTRGGKWCIRNEHHRGGHLPLPPNYPPQPVVPEPMGWCRDELITDYLLQKGEL